MRKKRGASVSRLGIILIMMFISLEFDIIIDICITLDIEMDVVIIDLSVFRRMAVNIFHSW